MTMTEKDPPKKKRVKHPKGFAQIPEWWMDTTPHDTLYMDGDEHRVGPMLKKMTVKTEWEIENEAKFTTGKDGELIDKKTGEPIETGGDTGYTREEKTGEWMKDGKLVFGRQFEGSALSPEYGHKDVGWMKPDWMKVSLNFKQRS